MTEQDKAAIRYRFQWAFDCDAAESEEIIYDIAERMLTLASIANMDVAEFVDSIE